MGNSVVPLVRLSFCCFEGNPKGRGRYRNPKGGETIRCCRGKQRMQISRAWGFGHRLIGFVFVLKLAAACSICKTRLGTGNLRATLLDGMDGRYPFTAFIRVFRRQACSKGPCKYYFSSSTTFGRFLSARWGGPRKARTRQKTWDHPLDTVKGGVFKRGIIVLALLWRGVF